MTTTEQIEELLDQLQNQTGVRFAITDSQIEEEETLLLLKNMINSRYNSTSKEGFLRGLLLGLFSPEEIIDGIHRFHLEKNGLYFLVLMEAKQPLSAAEQSVFSQLFSSGRDTLIQTDECHITLIRQLSSIPKDDALRQMVLSMQDTLETEAMISLHFAYDQVVQSLDQFAGIFPRLTTALEIGTTFSSNERIHWTKDLGLGKLIYHLPKEICEEYLQDQFQGNGLPDLDEESLHTIHTFLDCGLSIAECARKLYLHRNTLIYRLDKIQQQTGLDIRRFEDAITCQIALLIATRLHHQE